MSPAFVFQLAWGLFILSWIAAAFWSSPAVKRSPPKESLRYNLMIMLGAILLFRERRGPWARRAFGMSAITASML